MTSSQMSGRSGHSQLAEHSFRRFGPFGPQYEILKVEPSSVRIRVIETGEELDYPSARALSDPTA